MNDGVIFLNSRSVHDEKPREAWNDLEDEIHLPSFFEAALEPLAHIQHPSIIPTLFGMLASPLINVQRAAVRLLGVFGATKNTSTVIAFLASDDADMRHDAVIALAKIGGANAIEALLTVAKNDQEKASVRVAAIEKLPNVYSWASLNVLYHLLEPGVDSEVQESVIRALSIMDDQSQNETIIELICTSERDWDFSTIEGLRNIQDARMKNRLNTYFFSSDVSCRFQAIDIVGVLGGDWAIKRLITSIQKETEPATVAKIAMNLGALGDQNAAEILIKLLSNDNSFVVVTAVKALGRLGYKQAAGALIQAFPAVDERSQNAIVGVLGTLGDDTAVPILEEALSNESTSTRMAAVRAYVKIGVPIPDSMLAILVKDSDSGVRTEIARAIGASGDKKSLPFLAELVKDNYWAVSEPAIDSLVKILRREAYWEMNTLLKDPDFGNVAPVVQGIVTILGGKAANRLLEILNMRDNQLSQNAAFFLGKLGVGAAIGPLLEVLKSADTIGLTYDTIEALIQLGNEDTAMSMLEILDNNDNYFTKYHLARAIGILGGECIWLELLTRVNLPAPDL